MWEGMSRATVQTISNTALRPSLEFMDASVPADASVGLALGRDGFGFPAFGPRLERRVVLVPRDSGAQDLSVEWIYASRRRARTIDPDCWQRVLDSPGTVVLKRRDSCRAER